MGWACGRHRGHIESSRRGPRDPSLSHHRTCRSAYGGSWKTIKTPIPRKEAHESLLCKPFNRYRCIHVGSAGIPPRSMTVIGRGVGAGLINAPCHQSLCTGTGCLPLSPQDTAQLSSQPLIQLFTGTLDFCQLKILDPAGKEWLQIRNDPSHRLSPAFLQQFLDAAL